MDEQLLDMMRDRFDNLDGTLKDINETIRSHVEKDERYWKKIDEAEGQISLIKWIGGSVSISGALGWFFSHFGKH